MRDEILSANSKSLQIRKIILSIIFALLTVISLCMAGCKQESGNKPVPGPVDPIDPDIPDDPENPETQKIEINDVDAVVSLADAAVSEYFTASTEAEQIAALVKYASISDEKGGKSVRFSWKGNGSVKYTLYLADNERFENAKEYVASGLENELYVYNLVPSSAYYWKVCGTFDGDESATSHFTTESISLRCVFVDGAVNTRDIGGYAAVNGSVNYGKIYRGGNLDSITTAGAETLKNDLKIKTEIDLRKDGAQKTDRLGLAYYKFDAGSYTDILDLAAWNALPAAARGEFNAKYSAEMKKIFEILANEENYPVYIHCDNGADETGTVAFLINALLGVSESDLIRDFELSSFSAAAGARYRSALNADKTGFADSGVMKNDKTAFVAFGATIDALKTAYGATDKSLAYAVENYLTDYVGVNHTDVEKIKKIMLSSYSPSDVIYLDGERQVIEVSKTDNEINLGDTAYETVEGVYLGGNKIGDSISLIDGANLSGVYGERELTVALNTENGQTIVKVPVLVVTKYIGNADDLTASLAVSENGNFGYYELKNDITLDSLSNGAAGVAFDGSNGFRGIFEGKGHTITSALGDHGLFGFVGNGAIIRNVKFDISGSVNVMNKTIIADYVVGARIENVTINVATESAEFGADAGLVTSAAFNGNTVTGLIVNAKKAAVNSLFGGGKYLFDKNEFVSCFVNVKNIKELARNYVNGNYVSVYLEDASGFGGEITDVIDISVADVINVKGANIELKVGERFANTNVTKVVCNGNEIKERKFENGILYLFNDFAVFGENLGKTVINVTFEADNGIIVETKIGVVAFTDSEEVEFDETQEIFINRAENSIDLKNYAGSTVYSISVAGYYLGNDVNSLDIGDELKENKAQHGSRIMSVLLGNDGGYYTVYIPVTVVTAEISDISQLNAIMASDSTEYAIHGYYKLVADVGKSSDNLNNGNDVNWENDDGLYGFRGTLDGNGHSITATVLQKGTFGIVGSGAVIKNLTINAYGFADGRTVLARSIRSATVENVTYANGKLTLTDAFKNNAQKHGNQTLVVTVEKGGTYYAVSVKILVVTKEITTIDELTAALTPTANDAVYGYYRLKTDLSYSGWYTVGYAKSWTAPQRSNKNLGFRGTFDGNGKKITSWFYQDGLFGVVGSGAVIKNLTIDVKQYGNNGNLNLTLGYSMMEATLDTVTINVLSGGATSIPTNAAFGLLTCLGAYGNTLKNVNINANGLGIDTLFGTGCWFTYPTDYAANTFENCTITAQSLIGLACTDNANKTVIPYTGVSGLTVNLPA